MIKISWAVVRLRDLIFLRLVHGALVLRPKLPEDNIDALVGSAHPRCRHWLASYGRIELLLGYLLKAAAIDCPASSTSLCGP